jgi:dienelactone hydrolase
MKFYFKFLILIIFLKINLIGYALETQNIELFDSERTRIVPIVTYQDKTNKRLPIVIINHGYLIKNTEYSFIANTLALRGYFVASIQHELETDEPLPTTGNVLEKRKTIYERDVGNIAFVMRELQKMKVPANLDKAILIGHSKGGDESIMFMDFYPNIALKVVSLDGLRYPISPKKEIPILFFGSIDKKPDAGVLPKKGITIKLISGARHIDLCDRGSEEIKKQILEEVVKFLSN